MLVCMNTVLVSFMAIAALAAWQEPVPVIGVTRDAEPSNPSSRPPCARMVTAGPIPSRRWALVPRKQAHAVTRDEAGLWYHGSSSTASSTFRQADLLC
jgi:hypothetical protein